MNNDERKDSHVGFVSPASWDATRLVGSLTWGEKKYRITNVDRDGQNFVGDVQEKTEELYRDKNGVERNVYKNVGAIQWDSTTGDGFFVTDFEGITSKFAMKSRMLTTKDGKQTRMLTFPKSIKHSDNPFRRQISDAADAVIQDEIPDMPL